MPCEHMQASSVCTHQRCTALCSLISLSQIKGQITEVNELVQPLSFTVYEECNLVMMTMNVSSSHKALRISLNGSSCTGSVRLGVFQASGEGRIVPSVHRHISHGYLCLLPVWIRKKPLFLDTSWLKRHTRHREGFVRGCEGLVSCARTHALHLFLVCICKRLRANI